MPYHAVQVPLAFHLALTPADLLNVMCKGAECCADLCVFCQLPLGPAVLSHMDCLLQGCLPYAAWRASHPGQTVNKRVGAALALGWAQQVLLLDVPLVRPNADATAGAL